MQKCITVLFEVYYKYLPMQGGIVITNESSINKILLLKNLSETLTFELEVYTKQNKYSRVNPKIRQRIDPLDLVTISSCFPMDSLECPYVSWISLCPKNDKNNHYDYALLDDDAGETRLISFSENSNPINVVFDCYIVDEKIPPITKISSYLLVDSCYQKSNEQQTYLHELFTKWRISRTSWAQNIETTSSESG